MNFSQGKLIAGVDEVGRGPLAGAVVAAAVILDVGKPIAGLTDSKKLTEKKRDALFDIIRNDALAWAIGRAEVAEIDELNILHASMLAMQRAEMAAVTGAASQQGGGDERSAADGRGGSPRGARFATRGRRQRKRRVIPSESSACIRRVEPPGVPGRSRRPGPEPRAASKSASYIVFQLS